MNPLRPLLRFADFARNRRGNVAILTALMMIPMISALGMGVDYAMQMQRQDRLSGIADATALYVLTPTMMTYSSSVAQTKAQAFWSAQAAMVTGTTGVTGTVTVTDTPQGTTVLRTVSVSFTGSSVTYLTSLIGVTSLPLGGGAGSTSKVAPKINFYLLVDTSPSMGIAATQADINTMVANTSQQGGCAFACHETNPGSYYWDALGNPTNPATGQPGDNYYLARKLGVTLRIDLVNQALQSLGAAAVSTATQNNTVYGMSISTIDYKVSQIYQTNNIAANGAAAQAAVGTLSQLEVGYNACVINGNCNAGNGGNDQDSALDLGVSTLGTLNHNAYASANTPGYQMYTPGQGTSNSGDSPQEVLIIISDGMVDEYLPSYTGSTTPRAMAPINTLVDNCTAIKNSGIRIAFLYLTYNPLPTNTYYTQHIASFQPNIATAAEACASPGLYTKVDTGGDIAGALTNLFEVAVTTARLTR
jgi:Flp pilus assembly protein TadG